MELRITDNHSEMEEIGRQLVDEKKDIYTPLMCNTIKSTIADFMKGSTKEEIERAFYRSIYDYWVYGNSCNEEFYYKFYEKSHEEKLTYMTFRMHEIYCNHINCEKDKDLLVDKYKTYQLFKEFYLRDVIQIRDKSDFDIFLQFVKLHPTFVVKPKDLALGIGVYVVKEDEYSDYLQLFESILESGRRNKAEVTGAKNEYIVLEEIIDQDESMARIHPYSANGIRITTVKVNGKVNIYHPWFKIGANGKFVTCTKFGTMDAGINPNTGVVETNGFNEKGESFVFHPDTGIQIPGFVIPHWEELVSMATKLAETFDRINYIGWDFVLTPKGWCIMEANYDGFFMWQLFCQKGMKKEFEELIGWKFDKQFWWEV